MKRTALLLLCALAAPAAAEPQAPELKTPGNETDVWPPLMPIPATRPDVPWDKLMAGCTERKQVSKESRDAPVVMSHVKRSYDKDGRVVKIQEIESGKVATTTDYSYAGGRMTKSFTNHVASGSIGAYTLTYEYRYDAGGRMDHMTKHEVDGDKDLGREETSFAYDGAGRLVTRTDGVGKAVVWHYPRSKTGVLLGITVDQPDGTKKVLYEGSEDAKGRLARVKTPPDTDETVTYDAAGRELTRTSTHGAEKVTVTRSYDEGGRMIKLVGQTQAPDHTGSELRVATYDAKGRMATLSVSSGNGPPGRSFSQASEVVLTWDDKGRLVAEKEKAGGGDGMHGFNMESETRYSYDGAGRLEKVTSHAAGYPPLDRTITTTYAY
jgi:YD repeat-containing protein